MIYIIIAIVLLIAIYVIVVYNSFIQLNNKVKEAFSTMDVYLKKRWDLIPNLVEVVKTYTGYEKETLEEITKLRSDSYDNLSNDKKIDVNEQITKTLSSIIFPTQSICKLSKCK